MKSFFFIFNIFLIFLYPIIGQAFSIKDLEISSIYFDRELVEYETGRMYIKIKNNSKTDFFGKVSVSCAGNAFGEEGLPIFIFKNGGIGTVFTDGAIKKAYNNVSCVLNISGDIGGLHTIPFEKYVIPLDTDKDQLPDDREYDIGTDPKNPDTDGDGLSDGKELEYKTNPLKADTDGDGLSDGEEIKKNTNPLTIDTDGDGVQDGKDAFPLDKNKSLDTDGDGIVDTDDTDIDGDGILNTIEQATGTDPMVFDHDTDKDGLVDILEVAIGTDPKNPDTDGDGVQDGKDAFPLDKKYSKDINADSVPDEQQKNVTPVEKTPETVLPIWTIRDSIENGEKTGIETVSAGGKVFNTPDSDGDGLNDNEEIFFYHTDPKNPDTDGDGVQDGIEKKQKSNPVKRDTDDDGITDDLDKYPSDPLNGHGDSDHDGLTTQQEEKFNLNPNDKTTILFIPDKITYLFIKFWWLLFIGVIGYVLFKKITTKTPEVDIGRTTPLRRVSRENKKRKI